MLILEFRYKRQATATIFEVELHNMSPRETFAIALIRKMYYTYTVTGIVTDLPTNPFSCLPGSSAPFSASEGDLKRSRCIVHLKQRG